MANKYRPLSVVGKATYGEVEFEADLSPAEEADALTAGHLELVPRTYRVLSGNYTAAEQGKTFEATYRVENEAALIQGGHIERVDRAQGGPVKKGEPVIVGDGSPELFVPTKPGTVIPSKKAKD